MKGKDFSLTPVRYQTLQRLQKPVTVLHCCAGAGKTTILLCLCLWVLRSREQGYNACVHFMAASQNTVLDFLSQLRDLHGNAERIGPLGFDADSWTDRLQIDLQNKVLQSGIKIIDVINNVENCLHFLNTGAKGLTTFSPEERIAFLKIGKCVCTVHHVLLHRHYYTTVREQQTSILKKVYVLGSTVSYAHKLMGARSAWSKSFREFNNVLSLEDEIQSLGKLEMAGVCSAYDNVIAVGDENQQTNDVIFSPNNTHDTPALDSATPLREGNVMTWANKNFDVQFELYQETLRYNDPLLKHLKTLFPFMKHVTSKAPHWTQMLPLYFKFVGSFAHQTPAGEISREKWIFTSLLIVVALECVLATQIQKRTVLVICYLNRVVEDVKSFFDFALPNLCLQWHHALKLDEVDTWDKYSFKRLMENETLAVVGPLRCKGLTADVVFLLGMKRQHKDWTYMGLATNQNLLGIHYTRCRLRIYPFIHDLTAGFQLPTGGKQQKRSLEHGVSAGRIVENVNNSYSRQQHFYYKVKEIAQEVRKHDFNVTAGDHSGGSTTDNTQTTQNLWSSLPLVHNQWYKHLIANELHKHTQADILHKFIANNTWWPKIKTAVTLFDEMQNYWKTSSPEAGKFQHVKAIEEASFWKKSLSMPQCSTEAIPDTRTSDTSDLFHTSFQLSVELGAETDPRPSGEEVFKLWKHFMLDCSTLTIESHKNCSICVGFVQLGIEEVYLELDYWKDPNPIPNPMSPFWLVRALAEETVAKFKEKGHDTYWENKGYQFKVLSKETTKKSRLSLALKCVT